MKSKAALVFQFLKQLAAKYQRDNIARLSAALAYYAVFSMAPMLIIVVAVIGFFLGESTARDQVVQQAGLQFGAGAAGALQILLDSMKTPSINTLAAVIGVGTMLIGSTAAFAELSQSLNTIWDVVPQSGGFRVMVKQRALSFLMVLVIGVLILLSFVASAAIAAVTEFASSYVPVSGGLIEAAYTAASFIIFTISFALMFRVLPATSVAWRDTLVGAAVTSLLFTIGKTLIGLYLGHASPGSAYGAAGSLIVVLLWIYYSSQIFFIGAEFTQVYSTSFGSQSEKAQSDQRNQQTAPDLQKSQSPTAGSEST